MKHLFAFLFFMVTGILTISSCKSSGTDSENNIKDPRDMTWTCDTLYLPEVAQTMLTHFLAFSPKDIYAYGHSSSTTFFWHYDGLKWSIVDLINKVGAFNVTKLLGFSSQSIWGIGYSSFISSKIIRYDGIGWSEYNQAGKVEGRLLTASVDKQKKVYTAGDNGWVLYFDGSNWFKDQIKMYVPNGGFYAIRSSAIWKDTTYYTAYNTDNKGREVYYFIKGNYKNWVVADSMVMDNPFAEWKWGWWDMKVTSDNKLLSFGTKGIWEYKNKRWVKVYDSPENLVYDVFILNGNYKVAACAFSKVAFFDGSNWTDMNKFVIAGETIEYSAVWGDGKELFIMGYTAGGFPNKTIVWHGK